MQAPESAQRKRRNQTAEISPFHLFTVYKCAWRIRADLHGCICQPSTDASAGFPAMPGHFFTRSRRRRNSVQVCLLIHATPATCVNMVSNKCSRAVGMAAPPQSDASRGYSCEPSAALAQFRVVGNYSGWVARHVPADASTGIYTFHPPLAEG